MKINIKKLLTGGGVFFSAVANPFSNAAIASLQASTGSAKSSSSSSDILSKEVMNELLKKATPNEYRKLEAMLADFYSTETFGGSINKSKLHAIRTYANLILYLYNLLDKANDEAYKNESWGELAVDSHGRMYVYQDNKVKLINPSDFNSAKMAPITVGELSLMRAERNDLIDRTDITSAIGNSIGMSKISNFILSIIKEVGSSETSSDAFVSLAALVGRDNAKHPTEQLMLALALTSLALDKLGPDAIFKLRQEGNTPELLAAFKYIYSVLPNKMKHLIVGNWVANGGEYSLSGVYITQMITDALSMHLSQKETLSYEASMNKAAGNEKTDTRKLTTVEAIFNQSVNNGTVTFSDPNGDSPYNLKVKGSIWPSLALDGGAGAGVGALDRVLDSNGKGMGKYLDMSKIYFGTDKVPQAYLGKVFYKGASVANAWMPVTPTGDIDWESYDAFTTAEKEIEANNITNYSDKNKIHAKYGSPARYLENGLFISGLGNVALYLITYGFSTKKYRDKTNMFVELPNNEEKILNEEISTYNKTYKTNLDEGGWLNDAISIPIFIKVGDNANTSSAYYARVGSEVPERSLQEEQAYLQSLPTASTIPGSGMALFE